MYVSSIPVICYYNENILRTETVTPHPDEVHSTCNCKGAYVHQVSL